MKDFKNIQKQIINNISKGNKRKSYIYETGSLIYFSDNGYRIFVVPKDYFYLDKINFIDTKTIYAVIDEAINSYDYECADIENMFIYNEKTVTKLKSKTYTANIDSALLKDYGKDIQYRISSEKKLVLLYDANGFVIGGILPIFIRR